VAAVEGRSSVEIMAEGASVDEVWVAVGVEGVVVEADHERRRLQNGLDSRGPLKFLRGDDIDALNAHFCRVSIDCLLEPNRHGC
jgi:hypothetical protein